MIGNHKSLEGKIALVTGAAQGLGEASVRALARSGAVVIATDLNAALGLQMAAEVAREASVAVEFLQHNVASEADWLTVVGEARRMFGHVDILVNNAGVIEFAPIAEIPVEQFDRIMQINVGSVFLGCKHILPAMKKGGWWRWGRSLTVAPDRRVSAM